MVLLICVQLVGNEPRAFVRGEQLPPVTVWQSAVQQQQMYVEYLLFVCSTLTCSGYRAIEFVYMEYVCVCIYCALTMHYVVRSVFFVKIFVALSCLGTNFFDVFFSCCFYYSILIRSTRQHHLHFFHTCILNMYPEHTTGISLSNRGDQKLKLFICTVDSFSRSYNCC